MVEADWHKDCVKKTIARIQDPGIEKVVETVRNTIATDDAQEGLNAFNERRRPD